MSGLYKLGDYEIDVLRRQIRLNGEVVPIQQKPFEVLLALIARAGEVISKDELMREIWQEAFVEESNLTQSIFLLRKAFSDKASGSRYIVTVPGRGYQLGVMPVAVGESAAAAEIERLENAAPDLPLADLPMADRPLANLPLAVPRNATQPKSRLTLVAVAFLLLAMLGWVAWRSLRPAPFAHFSVKRLTNSGDIKLVAISRSGRYLASVSSGNAGRESLSVSDLRTGNARVVLNDDAAVFNNIVFSPDEAYVYYRASPKDKSQRISFVSRVPVLGGEPVLLVNDVDGPVAFIGDGQRICFWRGTGNEQFSIVSAGAE